MCVFLTSIHINKVINLENIDIDIDSQQKKHLIITGKNGSGKTSLLISIADFLQRFHCDVNLDFLKLHEYVSLWQQELSNRKKNNAPSSDILQAEQMVKSCQDDLEKTFGKVNLKFNDLYELSKKVQNQDYILAFYTANRKTEVTVPVNPEKPDLKPVNDINKTKITEFIRFLVDLKIQEALARNENKIQEADEIKDWFINFNTLLKRLFEDESVILEFNYKDYSFTICQSDKKFGFNELSDGYSAIIDIVADLIIKMQGQNSLTRIYEKQGIVLIDEIETHLHLKLQRVILPMLTGIFPNIQLIVTTHSPFVLNSLENVIAYDLERKIRLEDLTEYSYEALAEGYFKVETDSNFLQTKIDRFKELSEIINKDSSELEEYESLDKEFASMDETFAPINVKGQYLQIKIADK